jgi:hypothetical protein
VEADARAWTAVASCIVAALTGKVQGRDLIKTCGISEFKGAI